MGDLWVQDGQKLLFIGDSITDCGRRDAAAPLGDGYVRMTCEMIVAGWPERAISFINKGIGGHKVTDLAARWHDDVIYHQPDRLTVMIGINDLHSFLGGAPDGVSPERFAEAYAQILERTAAQVGCPVILMSPFYISQDPAAGSFRAKVLEVMPQYLEIVERLSRRFGARLVPLHDIFQRQLKWRDAETFCPEPVHPNHTGHMVIAQALLAAMTE
jgi:lysophospholipase L1-like esterase